MSGSSDEDLKDPFCDPDNPIAVQFQEVSAAAFKIKGGIERTACQVKCHEFTCKIGTYIHFVIFPIYVLTYHGYSFACGPYNLKKNWQYMQYFLELCTALFSSALLCQQSYCHAAGVRRP